MSIPGVLFLNYANLCFNSFPCKRLDVILIFVNLIASLLESSTLSERLASLSSQLESERISFSDSLELLKSEVADGCNRVAELEEALSSCQKELLDHLTMMEESTCQYKSTIKELQEQVFYEL